MARFVLATGNQGKAREFAARLSPLGHQLLTLADFSDVPDVDENADTFLGNALIKAETIAEHTGLPTLADDSGLCVDALGGAPGIHSARYGGPNLTDTDRINRLLAALADTPKNERSAHFACALCFVERPGTAHYFEGRLNGSITTGVAGDAGFGYDPIFLPKGASQTLAQISTREKNQFSHRARALDQFIAFITTRKNTS